MERGGTCQENKRADIPDLQAWLGRRHGEIDYYYTGHGNFNNYLHKIGKRLEPACMYCGHDDDADHTFTVCNKRAQYRLDSGIADMRTGEITAEMLQSEEKWRKVADFIRKVLKTMDADERQLGF